MVRESMKAIVYPKPNSFEVRELKRPVPAEGQALVRVMASTICATDLKILAGEFPGIKFPHIPGHEWSGEVFDVGKGVDELKPGDRVGAEPHVGCGRCRNCLRGLYNLCLNYGNVAKGHAHIGFTVPGGMEQYCVVSIKALHKLPPNLSFDEGAFTETVGVALYALERVGVSPGDDVLVIGPGAIGLAAVQLAKSMGAGKVVLAGTRKERLAKGRELGADDVVDVSRTDNPAAAVKGEFPQGPDVAIEVAGTEAAAGLAVNSVRRGGRVVLAGSTSPGKKLSVDISTITRGHLDIYGSVANPMWVCESALKLMGEGRVRVRPLMSGSYHLDQFGDALEAFKARKGGAYRVMIHPNPVG
jgi:L-iditol 2-dehydrogenase